MTPLKFAALESLLSGFTWAVPDTAPSISTGHTFPGQPTQRNSFKTPPTGGYSLLVRHWHHSELCLNIKSLLDDLWNSNPSAVCFAVSQNVPYLSTKEDNCTHPEISAFNKVTALTIAVFILDNHVIILCPCRVVAHNMRVVSEDSVSINLTQCQLPREANTEKRWQSDRVLLGTTRAALLCSLAQGRGSRGV